MSEKMPTQPVRASAALPASGAYDESPAAISLSPTSQTATLWCSYTRGGTGGSASLRFATSPDGTIYHWITIAHGSVTTTGPFGAMALAALQYDAPAPADGDPLAFGVSIDVAGARYLKVYAAESGNTGAPGTLSIALSEDAS